MAVNTIGGPGGTKPPSPARSTIVVAGARRHCAPVTTYHVSGPEWRWTVVIVDWLGSKVASM